MTPEERKARKLEQARQRYQANKEKEAERRRRYRENNKQKVAETERAYRKANKEKVSNRIRKYREDNKDKLAEKRRQFDQENRDRLTESRRLNRNANLEREIQLARRRNRKKAFIKEDGSSFESWLTSLRQPGLTFAAIANLQPNPGQTLAELIHKLSGYAMEVCEQIANPPVIEDPQPAQPTPQPDLF